MYRQAIQVFVRVRPPREAGGAGDASAATEPAARALDAPPAPPTRGGRARSAAVAVQAPPRVAGAPPPPAAVFPCDAAFGPDVAQDAVFRAVRPTLERALALGCNAAVLS
jgi:hypothetical protein